MALITYSRGLFRMQESLMVEITVMQHKGVNGNVQHVTFVIRDPCCLITPTEISTAVSGCLVEMAVVAKLCMYVCTCTYMHRYGCCTCTYMAVISLIFPFFHFSLATNFIIGALCLKREFGYIPNPDRYGVILGKPWILHGPSTF